MNRPSGKLPLLPDLTVRARPLDCLQLYPNNPRTHSSKQLHQIAKSIENFGFLVPILIDDDNRILAGHGRVEAAKKLGLTEVPTIKVEDLSESQKRAYLGRKAMALKRNRPHPSTLPAKGCSGYGSYCDNASGRLPPPAKGLLLSQSTEVGDLGQRGFLSHFGRGTTAIH